MKFQIKFQIFKYNFQNFVIGGVTNNCPPQGKNPKNCNCLPPPSIRYCRVSPNSWLHIPEWGVGSSHNKLRLTTSSVSHAQQPYLVHSILLCIKEYYMIWYTRPYWLPHTNYYSPSFSAQTLSPSASVLLWNLILFIKHATNAARVVARSHLIVYLTCLPSTIAITCHCQSAVLINKLMLKENVNE